jgi:hypothetical protein
MRRHLLTRMPLFGLVLLLFLTACSPAQLLEFAGLLPEQADPAGPMDGAVAALPTPDPSAATPTLPPSSFTLPTEAPTAIGPLATMTALAGLIATPDLDATPYTIAYEGRPHFVEFQARW